LGLLNVFKTQTIMDVVSSYLEAGMTAARQGNKAQARTHLLRVLASDSRNETAWLWLSSVMPTTEQALRCIEHLLTINPHHARAAEARDVLRMQLLLQEATSGTHSRSSTSHRRYLLGEALVGANVITPQQLAEALRRQAELMQHNKPMRLGELLIRLKTITHEQLLAALTAQLGSTAPSPDGAQAARFGEFLINQEAITRAQLHQALAVQQELRRGGDTTPLGEVLVRCGYLEPLLLHHMLLEWHHQRLVQDEDVVSSTTAQPAHA
jgi:plasmid stability protein